MTIEEFWAQDRALLSLEITAILIVLAVVGLGLRAITRRINFRSLLGRPVSLRLFKVLRLVLGLYGACVLVATLFPGDAANQNIGLGGLLLFFLWPIIALQIALAWFPWERHAAKDPITAWILLVCAAIIFVPLDNATLQFVFAR